MEELLGGKEDAYRRSSNQVIASGADSNVRPRMEDQKTTLY
jgi:hypothetical protein